MKTITDDPEGFFDRKKLKMKKRKKMMHMRFETKFS